MDLLRKPLMDNEWKNVVDNAIQILNAQRNRQGRKPIQWKNVAAFLNNQLIKNVAIRDAVYEGIVEDKNLSFNKWEKRTTSTYTQKEIDEVCGEWAKFLGNYVT